MSVTSASTSSQTSFYSTTLIDPEVKVSFLSAVNGNGTSIKTNGTSSSHTTSTSRTSHTPSTTDLLTFPGPTQSYTPPPGQGSPAGTATADFALPEKIGLGISAGFGTLAVFALTWFIVRKRRRARATVLQLSIPEHQPLKTEPQSPLDVSEEHRIGTR